MIKNTLWLLFLWMTACWSACSMRSDQLMPIDDAPYFSVRYVADSLGADSLTAGLQQVYLFTSHTADQQGVVTCTGTFTDVQCLSDTCPGRLRFEFRNTQFGQVVSTDSVFHLGDYRFRTNAPSAGPTVYRTNFQADTALGYTDFYWVFAGQSFAQGRTAAFDFSGSANSMYVELRADRNSGPTSQVQRRISLVGQDTAFPQLDLLISPQAMAYRLEAIRAGAPLAGVNWSNGLTVPTFEQDSLQPDYTVTGGVDANLASARLLGLPAHPGMALRTANFTQATTVVILPPDTLQFGTVALQWTDAHGQLWRSDQGLQPANTLFEVLETRPYELNEQGYPTWQLRVVFRCHLYNEAGQRMAFSGEGLIAVAYP